MGTVSGRISAGPGQRGSPQVLLEQLGPAGSSPPVPEPLPALCKLGLSWNTPKPAGGTGGGGAALGQPDTGPGLKQTRPYPGIDKGGGKRAGISAAARLTQLGHRAGSGGCRGVGAAVRGAWAAFSTLRAETSQARSQKMGTSTLSYDELDSSLPAGTPAGFRAFRNCREAIPGHQG